MLRVFLAAVAMFLAVGAASLRAADIAAVCFTPGGDCTGVVVREIESARHQVLVQAYSFTSEPIAGALVKAKGRGVEVRVILDRSEMGQPTSVADQLSDGGVPILVDSVHIAHNKVMVIDGATVITGSFNFTRAAQEHNAENLLVIRDAWVASLYARNWQERAGHSDPFR